MPDEYDQQVAHLAKLATDPGWVAYAKQRATERESLWPGITEAVRAEINRLRSRDE